MHALIAVDGSPQALAAVRFFAALPFSSPPKCTVVTALIDTQFDLVTTDAGLQIREQESLETQRAFDAALEILSPVCTSVDHKVQRQHPSQLILNVGKELNVDLIVLGSLGHSALYRMTLGSTADYVANHAKCSTLVVRYDANSTSEIAVRSVLLACDDSAGSRAAHSQLTGFQWCKSKSELHLTRLLERPKLLTDDEVYDPQMIAEKKQLLDEMCRADFAECNATAHVEEAIDIPSALCTRVERYNTDLMFVGDSGRSGLSKLFLGSTSRYLLHHTRCSLWIAREKHWK